MWNPRCMGNPGKVSDTFEYVCDLANDLGGVHTNSGIPNHAFALLVDGGTYNGQTIQAIGLTKAAHIYFRAADLYQYPATDFADHADAIEQSAQDLIGVNLKNLDDGQPRPARGSRCPTSRRSRKRCSPSRCGWIRRACSVRRCSASNRRPLCPAGQPTAVFTDTFENPAAAAWSVSHGGTTAEFTERDWTIVGDLPDDRAGQRVLRDRIRTSTASAAHS